MKKLLVMAGLLLTTAPGYTQDRARATEAHGVTNTSQSQLAQIVMACVNQPKFEKYYTANGSDAVNVIDKAPGIQLPAKAKALGRTLNSVAASELAAGRHSNYFSIGNVKSDKNNVTVSLTYFYNHTKAGYKVVMADMSLVKNGNQYKVTKSNFKGDL